MTTDVPGRSPAPTLESVASLAGVSRATASRVLNGSQRVSDAARDAVLLAVAQLSYVPNAAARSLVRRRSDSIAFVVSEDEERFFSDPFFAAVLRGSHAVVSTAGLQVVFVVVSTPDDREQFGRFASSGHVDGVILVSAHGDDPLPHRLRRSGVPVVLAGRPFGGDADAPYVDSDNVGGGRQAAGALLDAGRRRLATITGPADMSASLDRYEGFTAVLRDAGAPLDPARVQPGDFSVEGGRRAMERLLEVSPDLDGVFAANDLMAVGALQVLTERGRSVPGDVAVIGFDDVALAAAATPALTTVRQRLDLLGRELAQLLLAAVDGGPSGAGVVLPTELVRRAST